MQAFDAVFGSDNHLAWFDLPNKARANNVERNRFGRENRTPIKFAQDQRTDAERIAGTDQFFVGKRDEGVRTLNLSECINKTVRCAVMSATGDQLQDDFRV